jgi:hypothetical protein
MASGSSVALTLAKADVAQLSAVAASGYFSTQANWKYMLLYYLGSNGQKKVVAQRANSDFSKSFSATASSGVVYRLQKIVLKGRNNSVITVKRSALDNASTTDITIS